MLDYDGTLAPFTPDRDRAFPYAGVREILMEILALRNTRVVVISGRAIKDVTRLIALSPQPEIWGSHGWEHLTAEGAYELWPLEQSAQDGLREGGLRLDELGLAARREDKPVSVAVHWRGLSSAEADAIRSKAMAVWSPLVASSCLEVHPFDGGLELRVRGRHKGFAVDAVLASENREIVAAYLGDDLTDEDAFKALAGRGLRVLVRTEFRETLADLWLEPPNELLAFLAAWRDVCRSVAPLRRP
jgi:trehalose-phosphatase